MSVAGDRTGPVTEIAMRYGAIVVLLALAIAGLVFAAWHWLLALAVPLLLIATYDLFQTEHSLWRNYPLLSRVRWLMEDLRPYLRAYIVEGDLEGRPFNHDERALVYARAKGDLDSHPFGTELDVYSDEYQWLAHSMAPTQQAPAQWRARVGSDQCSRHYDAALLNVQQ